MLDLFWGVSRLFGRRAASLALAGLGGTERVARRRFSSGDSA